MAKCLPGRHHPQPERHHPQFHRQLKQSRLWELPQQEEIQIRHHLHQYHRNKVRQQHKELTHQVRHHFLRIKQRPRKGQHQLPLKRQAVYMKHHLRQRLTQCLHPNLHKQIMQISHIHSIRRQSSQRMTCLQQFLQKQCLSFHLGLLKRLLKFLQRLLQQFPQLYFLLKRHKILQPCLHPILQNQLLQVPHLHI